MSKSNESGEWRGERRADMEGEQREGGRWEEREGSMFVLGRGGMGGRAGERRAVLKILPDIWNEF